MTVKELIEKLQAMPQDAHVTYSDPDNDQPIEIHAAEYALDGCYWNIDFDDRHEPHVILE